MVSHCNSFLCSNGKMNPNAKSTAGLAHKDSGGGEGGIHAPLSSRQRPASCADKAGEASYARAAVGARCADKAGLAVWRSKFPGTVAELPPLGTRAAHLPCLR